MQRTIWDETPSSVCLVHIICVIYDEYVKTRKTYLRTVSRVQVEWVRQLAPSSFYQSYG